MLFGQAVLNRKATLAPGQQLQFEADAAIAIDNAISIWISQFCKSGGGPPPWGGEGPNPCPCKQGQDCSECGCAGPSQECYKAKCYANQPCGDGIELILLKVKDKLVSEGKNPATAPIVVDFYWVWVTNGACGGPNEDYKPFGAKSVLGIDALKAEIEKRCKDPGTCVGHWIIDGVQYPPLS
jgi:hypothetical protein